MDTTVYGPLLEAWEQMEAFLKNEDLVHMIAKRRLKLEALQQAKQERKRRESLPKEVLDLSNACMQGTAALKQFTRWNSAMAVSEDTRDKMSEDWKAWRDDEPWGPYLVTAGNEPPAVSALPRDLDAELEQHGEVLLDGEGLGVPGVDDVEDVAPGDAQDVPVD
jgi:hypothetical protein